MIRDVPAQPVMPITRIMIESLPNGQVAGPRPEQRHEHDRERQERDHQEPVVDAVRLLSIQPPKKPAEMPMMPPITAETSAAEMPTIIEIRVPRMSSESTSRPFSSVPSRWADDGAARMCSE